MTASRPPGANSPTAARSPRAISSNSPLTAMRSAWKTLVAGWRPGRPLWRASRAISRGVQRPVSDNEPGDAPALLFLAVAEEEVCQFFRAQIVNQIGGRGPGAGVEPHV